MSTESPGPDAAWDGDERRVARRRTKRRYRFIDRRMGFDRRKRYPVLGTMWDHPGLLVLVLVLLNALSVVDGWLTAAELGLGIASEGNPVLVAAAQHSPFLAIAVKLGGMLVASAIIWHLRQHRFVLGLAIVALAFFAGLVAYHVGSLAGLGWL